MGVSHSMNKDQVDSVLTQFEATTRSIKGIEEKMARVSGYMQVVQDQRQSLSSHADATTNIIDSLGDSITGQSEATFDYFMATFDHFAGLMETLEKTVYELKIQDAPRQIQTEFGPLLVPAVVLVVIVTASNCYFGFLLANDEELADAFAVQMDGNTGELVKAAGVDADEQQSQMDILTLFAIGHVVLIGVVVVYIVVDVLRRLIKKRWRRVRRPRGSPVEEPAEDQSEENSDTSGGIEPGSEDAALQEGRMPGSSSSSSGARLDPRLKGPQGLEPLQLPPRMEVEGAQQRADDQADASKRSKNSSDESGRRKDRISSNSGFGMPPSLMLNDSKSRDKGGKSSPTTPISQLLRKLGTAARESEISPAKEVNFRSFLRLPKDDKSPQARGNEEWLGECFIQLPEVEVHIAKVASSLVVRRLPYGTRIKVTQVIRGAQGKLWGRLSKPQGWILLADTNNDRFAVSKVRPQKPNAAGTEESDAHASAQPNADELQSPHLQSL